jgi:hypothetical protein
MGFGIDADGSMTLYSRLLSAGSSAACCGGVVNH